MEAKDIFAACIAACEDQRGHGDTQYNHGVDCCIHALKELEREHATAPADFMTRGRVSIPGGAL